MGEHDRDHYPRRPAKTNRPPERKPDLAATTPRARKRPPVVRYVPAVRVARSRHHHPAKRSTHPPHVVVNARELAASLLLGGLVLWMGWEVFHEHAPGAFFPHDQVVWFWSGLVLWLLGLRRVAGYCQGGDNGDDD